MLRKICLCLWLVFLFSPIAVPQTVDRNSKEYAFFRAKFEQVNHGDKQVELNEAFDAISDAVKGIQRSAPQVSLGGMLALVIWESEAQVGYYNTQKKENSFNPDNHVLYVPHIDNSVPYGQQPLARYSYQLGIVPVHTSNFRPCVSGTQAARNEFDSVAQRYGFAPTSAQLESVYRDFNEVCQKALHLVPDSPRAVDYYILKAHSSFEVPIDAAGSAVNHLDDYPLYSPRVTTPFFFAGVFAGLNSKKNPVTDDRSAICAWGGGDGTYCDEKKQDQILESWNKFAWLAAPTILTGTPVQ